MKILIGIIVVVLIVKMGYGFTEYKQLARQSQAIADCYSNHLGIQPPRVRLVNSVAEGDAEYIAGSHTINLTKVYALNHELIAHEVTHGWQNKTGRLKPQSEWIHIPYEQRAHEIEAYRWAANNWNICR